MKRQDPTTEPGPHISRSAVASFAGQAPPAAGRTAPAAGPKNGSALGWAPRLINWFLHRGAPAGAGRYLGNFPPRFAGQADAGARPNRANGEGPEIIKRLIQDDRYAFALLRETIEDISDDESRPAWDVLRRQMALVPAGTVELVLPDGTAESTDIPGFFLDRYAVTNRQFRKFVQSGGYDSLEIWPREVWPSVSRFTDRRGRPGPRTWDDGKYPPGQADHPVAGVCWYEAMAYARWVGKRLPTAAEWQKAGGWPEQLSGGNCNRFPWGDLFDPDRTNLWSSRVGHTVPVDAFPNGATPNGIFQMTGNVWEWLDDPLETIPSPEGATFLPWRPMRRIIGGAFNTYFTSESTCHFITGQGELDRLDNIGFRCAVSLDQLRSLP